MSTPALHLIEGELPANAPQTLGAALQALDEAELKIVGLQVTVNSQAGIIGKQRRELEGDDIATHPQRKEILDLIDRWKLVTKHAKAKHSKDRIELIKARLKDGYSIEQLELAIDGLGAFPFQAYGEPKAQGTDSQRKDKLSVALGGGEAVEKFAVLGYRARKEGGQ